MSREDRESSLVEPFRTQKDIMLMQDYFLENNKPLMFLLFESGISLGRRIGDLLSLKWSDFYYPSDGKRREKLHIVEEKTDKFASPYISDGLWNAISKYREMTGCVVSENSYDEYVFKQLSGTYKGKVLSSRSALMSLKQAAEAVGIRYNVGTHSLRKTFGYMTYNMFPNDPYKMQILQSIFNHSAENITMAYIGLTDDNAKKFYDGIGDMLSSIMEGKEISLVEKANNLITVDYDELRKYKREWIRWGQEHPDCDADTLLDYMEETDKILRYIAVV